MWLKADLHTHTQFSDGAHTVSEVAAKAQEFGCDVLAITDHGDRNLGAGTHEYIAAIEAARREFPQLTILAGIEWNVPPWAGDEHATVLLPPSSQEGQLLSEFRARFDDLDREEHDPVLADEGLEWLARQTNDGLGPVAIYEHPWRKRTRSGQIVGDLRRWRAVNDVVVGFSGAPGHQAMQALGAYRGTLKPIDRWDPSAAVVGDAWDRLLEQGIDVWGADAPSDFHDDRRDGLGDYWPGEFSETWLYVPDRSAAGALRALRAGAFFGVHGHIARKVELRVHASGLPRAAVAGEAIEVAPGAELTIELEMVASDVDWAHQPSRIDELELIGITPSGAQVVAACPPDHGGRTSLATVAAPADGIVFRARGRRIMADGPDLMFYTNPIRVATKAEGALPATADSRSAASQVRPLSQFFLRPVALVNIGVASMVGALLLLFGAGRRAPRSIATTAVSSIPPHIRCPEKDPLATLNAVPRRRHFLLAWLAFVAFAVYGSWVPLNFRPLPLADAWNRFRELPFLQLSIASRADWVANIVLFVPIGFCGLAACILDRSSRLFKCCCALLLVCFCASLSVAIEFSQVWFPPRTVSQNDIIAETIGGATGTVLWLLVGDALTRWLRAFAVRRAPRQQLDWLLQAYLFGLIFYALFPLDMTISPGELWQKYREGKFRLVPFARLEATVEDGLGMISDALLFVPVGMLAATAFCHAARPVRSLFRSLILGLCVAAGIELAQIFVYSRYVDVTQLVTAAAGISLGAAWRRWRLAQPAGASVGPVARRWMLASSSLAFIVYAVFLAAIFVTPFAYIQDPERLERRWTNFFNAPLTSLYWGTEYNALTQVLRKGLLFAPLGYLAVRITALAKFEGWSRLAGLAAGLQAAFVLAFGIEYAQIFRDGTTANFTDVLLCTLGAATALALALRIEGSTDGAEHASVGAAVGGGAASRQPAALPVVPASILLLSAGVLLAAWGLGEAWRGAAWAGAVRGRGASDQAPATVPFSSPTSDPNLVFMREAADLQRPPEWTAIDLPSFPGAYAIWGATGRDDRGHIWLGVSAAGVDRPSAHLVEFDPARETVTDRGNALAQLQRADLLRAGEGQMKIHSKIVQAFDGRLYFASMDEQGESDQERRLPRWGSHFWRLNPEEQDWEHLFAAPEGLIAVAAAGPHVYALGYFDHVLYQFNCATSEVRSIHVGSAGHHISRNFFGDSRGHVYVPRLRSAGDGSAMPKASLVEFDAQLKELAETPLAHYLPGNDLSSHGIVGVQPLADGSIVFTTHVGFLYQVVPAGDSAQECEPADVRALGWFHPRGEAYVSSLFTYAGLRYLVGVAPGKPCEWLVFDLERRTSAATPLPETAGSEGLLLYGSMTRDDRGSFYLVGAANAPASPAGGNHAATTRPIALRLAPPH